MKASKRFQILKLSLSAVILLTSFSFTSAQLNDPNNGLVNGQAQDLAGTTTQTTADIVLDPSDVTVETLEKPVVKTSDSGDFEIIKVNEQISYRVEKIPDVEKMKASLGLTLPQSIKDKILSRGASLPAEVDPMEGYDSLIPEKKAAFYHSRKAFLTQVARALNATKFTYGVGSLVGDKYQFIKEKLKSSASQSVAGSDSTVKDDISYRLRSENAVNSILQTLDYKLWNQAPLFIASNEIGLSLSVGIMIESGALRRGIGGLEELGLSLSFNKDKKALVFEIYHSSEKFSFTPAVVTVAGIVVKAGPHFGSRTTEKPMGVSDGVSFYPPVIPGFSSAGRDFFSAGASTSFGFPPSPFVDLLTYTNKIEKRPLVRITISPIMKGFVRIYVGQIPGAAKVILLRFYGMYEFISEKVTQVISKKRQCSAVF